MTIELYNDGEHLCLAFHDLVRGSGIQANQFLIKHGGHTALIDPGGALTYTPLSMALGKLIRIKELDYVLASHQDPDIITSLDKWLMYTDCKVVISRLWDRFLPHLVPGYSEIMDTSRIISLPDKGEDIPLGDSVIRALPAHFLHSVGNFSFYDPVSKILFSGDIGASTNGSCNEPVKDFERHVHSMSGFHKRYMGSNKACRHWVQMVRQLDVQMIVPQHGCAFADAETIDRFLNWFDNLQCGTDLVSDQDYAIA